MFSLKAHQSENKIISVLKLSCKDDFNQAKFNKYNVHVQPINSLLRRSHYDGLWNLKQDQKVWIKVCMNNVHFVPIYM
jgi:hypothetical protein